MLQTTLRAFAGLALLAWAAPAAPAADYPTRPVTLVVAFPPGGASDVLARIVGRKLEQVLAQPFVIDNRPGAGGNVAAEVAAHAAPDGYTLLAGNNAILATNAALYKKINFDPVADFAPVGLIGSQANILVVNPGLPVKSMAELIALAKAQPGKLNFASSGHGLAAHLAGELFKAEAKIDIVQTARCGRSRSPPSSARRFCPIFRPWTSLASRVSTPPAGTVWWRRRARRATSSSRSTVRSRPPSRIRP